MRRTLEAVYENGVLRPLQPLTWLSESETVAVTIERYRHPLADCTGILPDQAAEEMRRVISDEFEKVDPDEWR